MSYYENKQEMGFFNPDFLKHVNTGQISEENNCQIIEYYTCKACLCYVHFWTVRIPESWGENKENQPIVPIFSMHPKNNDNFDGDFCNVTNIVLFWTYLSIIVTKGTILYKALPIFQFHI